MQFDPNQFRKPEGDEGRSLIESMNEHHRPLMEWAIPFFPSKATEILDIGCGGGLSMELLAGKYGGSHVTGIDHSADAVEASAKRNSDLVDAGGCKVLEASVSQMPFKSGSFDLVTAFETYFFWPDQKNDIAKACDLVAPGGTFAIVSEVDLTPESAERVREYEEVYGMKILDEKTMRAVLESCGMEVSVLRDGEMGWITYLGRRP